MANLMIPRMTVTVQVGCLMVVMLVQLVNGVKDVPQVSMEALVGETIYLPCNISTHEPGDSVVLVLWYREDKGSPIYSADTRGRDVTSAKRWSDETVFGQRAYFLFDKQPGELAVQNAREPDSGVYRCRVDFIVAQTRNSIVNLTIIVPPERVVIRDQQGTERTTVAGPYSEGDVVRLRCDVYGGRPLPTVSWYRDGAPLVAETKFVSTGKHLRSEIVLGPLTRQDLHSKLVCKANNHVRASPVEQSVQIDMNFAPLNIRLIGAHQPLSAGHRYDLLCQSAGSRPAASITWFLDGIRLDKSKETTSADGNQTTSTLSISLNRTDAGKYLSCKAYNTYVPSDALEDGWQLDIQYVPDAQVRLGSSLDPDSIREGTDVYFDCIVTAHPGVYKVEWKHNNKTLPHNISQGVIISNQSLVLQGVSRTTAGNYSCVGFNAEGEGASPVFPLNVMYAPTCAPNQQRVYGVAKQENAEIRCVVDANPPDVEFKWTFNNSAESIDVQASHISRLVGTSSVVSYTPMTELDYGTLLCVATNRIGKQRQACVFHIIAAGRPDQVHNCSLANVSMTSLNVRCYEGFNGGLAQSFFLELRDTHTQEVRFNNTAPIPRFAVPNLHPSAVYQLSVYAFNSKGKSEPYVMSAATLRLPEKQMNSEKTERPRSPLPLTPTLSIAIGLGAAILIGSCAIVLAFKFPCGGATRRRNKETGHHNHQSTTVRTSSPGPSDKSVASKEYDGNESDEKNPDVIPDTIDSDDQMEYIRRRQHISTIDTSSPSRLLLTTTSAVASQAQQQNFMGSTMTLGGNHASLGYCTLRNGGGMGLGPQNQVVTNVSMAHGVGPSAFTSSTCTLPRHPAAAGLSLGGPGVSMAPHHWPSYGGTIAGVRNLTAISVTSSQHTIPPPPPSTIAMQHLGGAGTLPRGGGAGASFLDHHQHQHQQQQPRSRVCLAEEDVSADTPLMVKRESTV